MKGIGLLLSGIGSILALTSMVLFFKWFLSLDIPLGIKLFVFGVFLTFLGIKMVEEQN